MLQSPEAQHRAKALAALGSVETDPHPPQRMAPSGVLLLRVMATRVLADLLLLGESNPGHSPRQPPVRRRAGMPPIRSLRLRHTTLWLGAPPLAGCPASRPLRQLVNVLRPV